MYNKTKIAIALLALTSLVACDSSDSSDDTATINSGTTVGVVAPVAVDIAVNGSFEDWTTDATPKLTGWTLIDSWGVAVALDTTTFETEPNSGAFTITNNKPDVRQSVDVEYGKTYTLSMSVYHPANGLKTRLYVNDYTDVYSVPALDGEWQKLSFEYQAPKTMVIEIGMRFYTEGSFDTSEVVYIDNLTLMETGTAKVPEPLLPPPTISEEPAALAAYYISAEDKTGFVLKTALYDIIKGNTTRTYGDLWTFMSTYSLDTYYENDNTILDMYTENPSSSDSYNFTPGAVNDGGDQCGNSKVEGDCYNREHSFPQSWFDYKSPMKTDIHHIFATDGTVNGKRSNFPYGEVDIASYTSSNGSKLGTPIASIVTDGFAGDTVFEPIDEFKGDLARTYFYMATRYEKTIGSWATNSDNAEAVIIDGSTDVVFEPWVVAMLKRWNENDPVSPKEQYRNDAALQYQGNRNPFVDHPEYVNEIWAD
jgi:endonuclease I